LFLKLFLLANRMIKRNQMSHFQILFSCALAKMFLLNFASFSHRLQKISKKEPWREDLNLWNKKIWIQFAMKRNNKRLMQLHKKAQMMIKRKMKMVKKLL
jgi:hypothetical protein